MINVQVHPEDLDEVKAAVLDFNESNKNYSAQVNLSADPGKCTIAMFQGPNCNGEISKRSKPYKELLLKLISRLPGRSLELQSNH